MGKLSSLRNSQVCESFARIKFMICPAQWAIRFALLKSPFTAKSVSLSSEDLVARVLVPKFLFSPGLGLILAGSNLGFVSSTFNACGEVTGVDAILSSFLISLQNSENGGYSGLKHCLWNQRFKHPSSGSSSTSHLSTTLLHLATMWVGSFLIMFWFLSGSLRTFQ